MVAPMVKTASTMKTLAATAYTITGSGETCGNDSARRNGTSAGNGICGGDHGTNRAPKDNNSGERGKETTRQQPLIFRGSHNKRKCSAWFIHSPKHDDAYYTSWGTVFCSVVSSVLLARCQGNEVAVMDSSS